MFNKGLPDGLEHLWLGVSHLLPVTLLLQLFKQELLGQVKGSLVLNQLIINLLLILLKL